MGRVDGEPIGGWSSRAFATLVVRLRWPLLAAWVAAAIAASIYLPSVSEGSAATLGDLLPANSQALETEKRALRHFKVPLLFGTAVVQRNPRGMSREAQLRVAQRALRIDRHRDPELRSIRFALPVTNFRGLFPSSRERGTTAITFLAFRPDAGLSTQDALAHSYADRIDRPGDALVGVTGAVPARTEQFAAIKDALPIIELATVGLIALILALSFRSVGPPLITLATAGIAFVLVEHLLGWFAGAADISVPREVKPVLVALLLGIVTDYAVFYFAAARRRLEEGEPRVEVALRTATEYGPIIVTAGVVVAAGTATLMLGTLDVFRSFGPAMALSVLTGLAVAATFVPASIAIFGRLIFWPSLRPAATEVHVASPTEKKLGSRQRIARVLSARPMALALVLGSVALLTALSLSVGKMNLGFRLIRSLDSSTEPQRAAKAASRGFALGILGPTELLLEGPGLDTHGRDLARLQRALARERGVAAVIGPPDEGRVAREFALATGRPRPDLRGAMVADDGRAARYLLIFDRDPQGGRGINRYNHLAERLPQLLDAAGLGGVRASFAGETALASETVHSVAQSMKRIAVGAFLVNLLLLALFLRALIAPLYLVAASALGLTASLGLTTLVFQQWLNQGDLTYYVPLAAGVLLVSLGSDYNLFLVGRIWVEARRRPLRDAIAFAVPRASRAIRIAGLALASSFALLAIVPLDEFRVFAFAMAAGVLIDTLLVRAVLVPALIAVFGGTSWWPRRGPAPQRRQDEPVLEPHQVSDTVSDTDREPDVRQPG